MTYIETPRPPVNPGEEHIACAVVVDTSGSMVPYAQELQQAIADLAETINADDTCRGRIELCLITYDDKAKFVQPFGPMHSFEAPRIFDCGGMTGTHQAIRLAIDEVNARKEVYRASSISYRQPWIWLFTDGASTDADNGSYAELLQLQNNRKLSFYGVGIGPDADSSELKSMHKNGIMLRVSRENFKAAFEFLSSSLSQAGAAQPGAPITVPVPPTVLVID